MSTSLQTYYPMKRELPAFLASIESYKGSLPETVVGSTRPIGEISFRRGLVSSQEVFVRFFSPDFSKYSFVKNVFVKGNCRPGVGLPSFFGMDSSKWLRAYPMSLVPSSLDQDVVVFSAPSDWIEFSPVRATFWTLHEDHEYFVQKNKYYVIAFSGKDAFAMYMQAMAKSYKKTLEDTVNNEIASANEILKRAAEAKASIEAIDLDEVDTLSRVKTDIIGV